MDTSKYVIYKGYFYPKTKHLSYDSVVSYEEDMKQLIDRKVVIDDIFKAVDSYPHHTGFIDIPENPFYEGRLWKRKSRPAKLIFPYPYYRAKGTSFWLLDEAHDWWDTANRYSIDAVWWE